MDYQLFLMKTLADASQMARDHFGRVTSATKNGDTSQVVTEADIEIGRMMCEESKRTYPTHNILDEETGIVNKHSPYTWVIDPIDGTSNFAQASPLYGCMLGLLKDHEPVAGGFALPAFHEIYTAERGKGAYCNQQRVRVQDEEELLLSSLIAYGVEGHQDDPNRTRKECELLAEIILACRSVQNSSSVFDAAMVVKGVYGGFLYQNCKIWDNVAQQILLEEAGAVYTDFFGQPIDYRNPLMKATETFSFCAAPPALHRQLQQIISTWSRSSARM
jgi:myo-inositol-1(or 4)-monophosphatase